MKLKFDVTAQEYTIIQTILEYHLSSICKVWVFGSRAKSTSRFNSDLDLALDCRSKIPAKIIATLKEAFNESKLAFSIDLVDMHRVEAYFKQIIDEQKVTFPLRRLVPELRFSEFASLRPCSGEPTGSAQVLGEWEEKNLRELTSINQGLQISIAERYTEKVDNSYFYITNEFLKENSDKVYYIKNPNKSVICDENDILMTRTGNTGQVVTNVRGAFHNNFFKIKYLESVNKDFLVYFLRSVNTQNTILKLAGSSTIPDLNHGDFYRIKINIPSLPEQQKIATFLSAVDKKLGHLRRKYALLENYKHGVIQKIFSQEFRFKQGNGTDFPDWDKKCLGEISVFYDKQRVPLKEGDRKNKQGQYPYYGASGIIDYVDEYIFDGEYILLGEDGANIISRSTKLAFLVSGKFWVNNHAHVIKSNTSNKFLAEALERINYEKYNTGTAQPKLNAEICKKIPIIIPSLPEQQKIANFLSTLDKKLEAVQTQIAQTETFKKGLLQKMFV